MQAASAEREGRRQCLGVAEWGWFPVVAHALPRTHNKQEMFQFVNTEIRDVVFFLNMFCGEFATLGVAKNIQLTAWSRAKNCPAPQA
jgi:hypothetical protein